MGLGPPEGGSPSLQISDTIPCVLQHHLRRACQTDEGHSSDQKLRLSKFSSLCQKITVMKFLIVIQKPG